ncbi:MAG: TonB-dependent receptor [Chitinophagaceae bacterium]|nr:MAG: TonB-dependent receptor [Chitinophagaceae bacterium]
MKLVPVLSILFLPIFAAAQGDPEPQHDNTVISINSSRVYGKIQDKASGKGIEAASVQLFLRNPEGKDSLLRGMLTRANGDYNFDNLPASPKFLVRVTAIGFVETEKQIDVTAASKTGDKFSIDMGNLELEAEVRQLGAVTVTASRPALEMGIDRKVFNASKSLVSTGGTAVDLMKNIPSVSVDIDGNVQLRNSSPQIFVDGRPTILSLDQIPADNIERVELITNPSARFDAASSGGIINIVLKKNKRVGLNGVASIGVGTPGVANSNLNVNLRQGKFNIFAAAGYNRNGGNAKSKTERINRQNGQATDLFNQYSNSKRKREFRSLRFGADFFVDNRNTISFTQQLGAGHFNYVERQDQDYLQVDKSPIYFGDRTSEGRNLFRRNASILNYKHSFPQTGKELTADINYNYGNRRERSSVLNSYANPDGSVYQPSSIVNNNGGNNNDQVTFQVDFVNPVSETKKFEAGLRSYHNSFRSLLDVFALTTGTPEKLPLSNNYKYREMVNAAYATYTNKIGNIGYQIGLRAEYSKFSGELIDSSFNFGYEYPDGLDKIWNALFPSLFLTHKLDEKTELQFNYSRRIRRPDFWQLNPSIDVNDPANLRQGNINLRPEFISSFELNLSKDYKSGNLLAVLYFRSNPDDITQYSDTISAAQYEQLQNAAIDPNAILNTYINANTTNRYGVELTLQHKAGVNFTLTPTANLQYRTVNANVTGQDLSNEGFNWEAKLVGEYKATPVKKNIFTDMSFQLLGEYESGRVIPQGRDKAQYSVDFAVRKDFLKAKKATLTLGVNDLFNTNRWGTIYDTDDFYQDSYRRWNVRSVRLTFSYKFGNADFSLLNKNRRSEGGGD